MISRISHKTILLEQNSTMKVVPQLQCTWNYYYLCNICRFVMSVVILVGVNFSWPARAAKILGSICKMSLFSNKFTLLMLFVFLSWRLLCAFLRIHGNVQICAFYLDKVIIYLCACFGLRASVFVLFVY